MSQAEHDLIKTIHTIDSCHTEGQLTVAQRMVHLWMGKYKPEFQYGMFTDTGSYDAVRFNMWSHQCDRLIRQLKVKRMLLVGV